MRINANNIIVSLNKNQEDEIFKELKNRGVEKSNIQSIIWNKRSIDSRQKNDIKLIYNLEVILKKEIELDNKKNITLVKDVEIKNRIPLYPKKHIAIVGAGPAGLFAGLRLAEFGYIPHIFERGEKVEDRDKTTEKFVLTSELNVNSNIQFGEGGAGTYSDGKLNTRIRSEYIEKVFNTFVECGANQEILWDYKPHIGTDVLKVVVKNLRKKIESLGGKFYFNHKIERIIIKDSTVKGIEVYKNGSKEFYPFDDVILAIGHSARDTYEMLHKEGVNMSSKPFAIGCRIEHFREDIDKMQYGKYYKNDILGAATYNVTYNNKVEDRGTFSFCMCPGGVIVNATSELNSSLVNGMSYSDRGGRFSNSAIVVGVKENEFGDELFSGMNYQRELEKKTFELSEGYGALYQNVIDFMKDKKTTFDIESSYQMKKTSYNLNKFFPEFISNNMKKAFEQWGKNPLFISKNVNLIAPETRTSAPIRINRDMKGMSINTRGLYLIGEGAGYAGGIVSAGVDGLKIVDLAFAKIKE